MPPAYIQVLTAGWFFATMPIDGFNWFLPSPKIRETVFVLVLFAVLGAAIDDQVTPRVLGYATPSALQVHCLVAKATIVEVQTRIMTDTYRRVIGLQKAPVETEEAVFLRRHKSEQWQVLIMLRKGKVNHETELAITAFNKEQYEISVPETAKQLAREKSLYIKEILMRPGQGATSINVREQKNKTIMAKDHDVLSSFVEDIEATGIFERVSKVSANIWVRIGLFAISYAVPVWLYVNNHLNDALTTFATITVTLAILSGVQLYSKKTK